LDSLCRTRTANKERSKERKYQVTLEALLSQVAFKLPLADASPFPFLAIASCSLSAFCTLLCSSRHL
jgi:hypothetical protein